MASSRAASFFSGTASASAMSFASPPGKVFARNSTFAFAHRSSMARMRAIKALSQRPSCFASNSKALTPPAASSFSSGATSGSAVRPNQSPAISTTTTPRSPRRAASRGGITSEIPTLTSSRINTEPLSPIDAQPGCRRNPVHRHGCRRPGSLRGVIVTTHPGVERLAKKSNPCRCERLIMGGLHGSLVRSYRFRPPTPRPALRPHSVCGWRRGPPAFAPGSWQWAQGPGR